MAYGRVDSDLEMAGAALLWNAAGCLGRGYGVVAVVKRSLAHSPFAGNLPVGVRSLVVDDQAQRNGEVLDAAMDSVDGLPRADLPSVGAVFQVRRQLSV